MRISQRLWLCRLLSRIPGSLGPESLSARPTFLLLGCIRCDEMSEVQPREFRERRRQRAVGNVSDSRGVLGS